MVNHGVLVFKAIFLLHNVCVCACLYSEREWVCVYQGLNLALLRVWMLPVTDGHCLILFQSLVVLKDTQMIMFFSIFSIPFLVL